MSPILPIQTIPAIDTTSSSTVAKGAPGTFSSMLQNAIGGVEQAQNTAHQAAQNFITGESDEVHSTALASQRAELEFELFLQVRNKLVAAYTEVMHMQV
jgi:flagellar hook-basal body complex protein FliE